MWRFNSMVSCKTGIMLFIIKVVLTGMLNIFTLENRKILPLHCKEPFNFLLCATSCRSAQAAPQLTLWAWEHQWKSHRDCCMYPASSSACCPYGAGIDLPSCVLLIDPAPEISNWGKQRAVLGSAWIGHSDKRKARAGEGRRGKMSLQAWYGVGDWLLEQK